MFYDKKDDSSEATEYIIRRGSQMIVRREEQCSMMLPCIGINYPFCCNAAKSLQMYGLPRYYTIKDWMVHHKND